MEKVQDDQFITIHGWMRTRLGLTTNELFLYALIYGYNWASKKEFYGSIKYMQEWLGIGSDKTVRTALKKLCDKHLLLKRTQNTEIGTRVYYRINPAFLPRQNGTANPLWQALNATNAAHVSSLPRLDAAAASLELLSPLEINTALKNLPDYSVKITNQDMQNLPDTAVEITNVSMQNLPSTTVESTYNNNRKTNNEKHIEKINNDASFSIKEKKNSQEEVAEKPVAPAIDYGQMLSDYDASTKGEFMHRILYNETHEHIREMKSGFGDVDIDF